MKKQQNFIERGKQCLDKAETVKEADFSMKKSCYYCVQQNYNTNCDQCAIREYYDIVVTAMKLAQNAYPRKKPWISISGNTMRFF